MGKALIIKNVNFNTNKLTTVNILADIACTAISLNKSSTNLTAVGATETLTASVSPSGCTDIVSWSSSDTNVVTVNSGVLTETGIGTATITATCGSISATCVVTTVNTLNFVYSLSRYSYCPEYTGSTGRDYIYQESGAASYAALFSSTPTEHRIWSGDQATYGDKYPILLGSNASKVNITVPSGIRATVWFTDSTQSCDYGQQSSGSLVYAKVISGDSSAYDSSVSVGNREVTVPSGADSISISLQYPSGTITDEIMAQVSVVVS